MAKKTKPDPVLNLKAGTPVKAGAAEPILTCPFTGKPLEIVEVGRMKELYQARGSFWSSKLYKFKKDLLFDLSHRDGVAPQFSSGSAKISVRHLEEPEPNPNADLVVEDVIGDRMDNILGGK